MEKAFFTISLNVGDEEVGELVVLGAVLEAGIHRTALEDRSWLLLASKIRANSLHWVRSDSCRDFEWIYEEKKKRNIACMRK
jgi:hypothetical protein